jgi:tRNA(Arg) A34 adenosine deaminase TadA
MDALEYSRVVHAEMNAICDAARVGRSLQDASLYCTTFPCHMCAKQIIAAGIGRVIFLEPYPKSLASELHIDALQIEGGERGQYSDFPAVQFLHFFGVTPRRYRELFERRRRKDVDGKLQPYSGGSEREPLIDIKSPFYTQPEAVVLHAVKNKFLDKIKVDETILQSEDAGSKDS